MTESELRDHWQADAVAPIVSLAYVRHRMQSLEERARRRNAFEYLGAVLGFVVLGWTIYRIDDALLRIAAALCLAGATYTLWKWRIYASLGSTDDSAAVGDALSAYRRELKRQHTARHRNWRWYILPCLPGTVLLLVASFLKYPERTETFVAAGALAAAWIGACIWGNARAAASLQREIDAIDSLRPSTSNRAGR
jgi:hypothetical protein